MSDDATQPPTRAHEQDSSASTASAESFDAGLSPQDDAAMEALIGAGFDLEHVEPEHRDRASALLSVLGMLDEADATPDRSLVDLTMVRIRRAAGITLEEPALSNDDQDALDALVLAGFEVGRVPSSLRQRAAVLSAMGELVHTTEPPPPATSLTDSTLARVQRAIDEQDGLMSFERRRSMSRVSLSDVISVAAVVLLAASVLWPVLTAARSSQIQASCAQSMHAAAFGLSSYASGNDSSLPMAAAGFGGGTWWNVGEGPSKSNSSNLFHLVNEQHSTLSDLACAGNPLAPTHKTDSLSNDWRRLEEVSYSYRVIRRGERPRWSDAGQVVVMTDRSPVVLRAVRGDLINPVENSPNHRGTGQHVLWNDGSARWMPTPELENGDNLWLPRPIETAIEQARKGERIRPIRGTETPAAMDDAFVGP